jgi:hypothetical protein
MKLQSKGARLQIIWSLFGALSFEFLTRLTAERAVDYVLSSQTRFHLENPRIGEYSISAELAANMRLGLFPQLLQKGIMDSRIFELALETLELKKAAIDAEIAILKAQLGDNIQVAIAAEPALKGRKGKSAAERKAVSLRMKAYWAARRKAKASAPARAKKTAAAKAESEMTAANKARSEKLKASWAKRRKAGKAKKSV